MPGFPSSRLGDLGAHGDVIVAGSPNVNINNLPAARVFDAYVCPIVGIGIIIAGSQTVKINNVAAARVTSLGACSGVTVIVTGSPNTNTG